MTVNGFRTPEEAALGLDLPLVGTLPAPGEITSPVAALLSKDEQERSEYRRLAERILEAADSVEGPVGVVGDLTGPEPDATNARGDHTAYRFQLDYSF